jgi:hypothetical protein
MNSGSLYFIHRSKDLDPSFSWFSQGQLLVGVSLLGGQPVGQNAYEGEPETPKEPILQCAFCESSSARVVSHPSTLLFP